MAYPEYQSPEKPETDGLTGAWEQAANDVMATTATMIFMHPPTLNQVALPSRSDFNCQAAAGF